MINRLNANTALFCILVVITGGCYPALALCSSNIFGIRIFSSGLTQYELGKLSKIKVFSTVVIENVPQLIFQALYSVAINEFSDAVGIAFFASILSVTASTLGYLIDRDAADVQAVHYYLSMECQRGTNASSTTIAKEVPENARGITDQEKENIINNRGRTKALGESLASLFCIPHKNIEIGWTMTTQFGSMTHIVHYVNESDLEMIESEINEGNVLISPKIFVAQLCASLQNEITEIFRNHFELNEEFFVSFRKRTGLNKNVSVKSDDNDNQGMPDLDKRESLLRRVVTENVMARASVLRSDEWEKEKLGIALRNYFDKYGKEFDEQQKHDTLTQLLRKSAVREKERQDLGDLIEIETGDDVFDEHNNEGSGGLLEMTGLPRQGTVTVEVGDESA